ncbi:hypothetical protein LCGC14_1521930 [marine sediment metagenome]|uniref:Uncharacterized protein n=1 Tax=marine sediment metagenome TaxID=412755 RepID=A0A0F9LZG0_9ZZZZ
MSKVSDFKLAESVLRAICNSKGVSFADLDLDFEEDDNLDLNCINVGGTKNVVHTIYRIVDEYLNIMEVDDRPLFEDEVKKGDFLLNFASELRNLFYKDINFSAHLEELTIQSLYQRPFIWVLMKDLICPIFNVPLDNIKIVCGKNPYIDIAKFYKEGDVKSVEGKSYPFIFVNDIDCQVVQNAFIFVEVLKAYNLEPIVVVKEILQTDLLEKLKGLLKIAFSNDQAEKKFIFVLTNILNINLLDFIPQKGARSTFNLEKYAQMVSPEISSQWWYLGVLERMIEPIRGTDWSTHQVLEKYHQDFWDRVEKIKQKREANGKDKEVPFDLLLRIKSKQTASYPEDYDKTLQSLLSSSRIW